MAAASSGLVSAAAFPRAGARLRLVGLKARPDLNGVEVTLLEDHGERWAMRCTLSGEGIRVKPANAVLCQDLELLEEALLLVVLRHASPGVLRSAAAASRRLHPPRWQPITSWW